MQIEGKKAKPFRVFTTDTDNNPHDLVAEYDTVGEVQTHKWRLDKRYKIEIRGRKFLERREFDDWAKDNS